MACFSSPPFLLLALSFLLSFSLIRYYSLGWFSKNRLDLPSQFPSQSHLRNGQPCLSSLTCIVFFYFFFYFKVPRLKGPRNFLIWKSRNVHAAACSPLKDKDSSWQLSMIFPRPQNSLCWGHLLLCWTSQRNFFLTVCQIVGQMCLAMIYFRRDFFGLFV